MNKVAIFTLLSWFAFHSLPTWAQEQELEQEEQAEVTVVTESSEASEKQQEKESEVTNAKLRAEMGSKSRYSFSADLSYGGSSLHKPLSDNRPNPDKSPVPSPTFIAGEVSGRYRIDTASSITAGTGLFVPRPFTTSVFDYTVEVSDPFMAYNYARKVGDITRVNKVAVYAATSDYYSQQNVFSMLDFSDVSLISGVGGTELSVGLALSATKYFYDAFDESRGMKGSSSYEVGFAPFAEYQLSDMFMLRSVVGFYYKNLVNEAFYTLAPKRVYQTLGLGIAFTPEIYLYTFIQHHPMDVSKGYNYWSKSASLSSYLTFSVF